MARKSQSSRITDVEEEYITPTDVKQYVFCPRVTFFARVKRLRPLMGSQQEEGQKKHDKFSELEKRRKSILKSDLGITATRKLFDIPVVSHGLGVHGRLDMLLVTSQNEHIPVEFKEMTSNRGRALMDHKYQLVILGLLVEESFNTIVRRGIIHYSPEHETTQTRISMGMKRRAEAYIERIWRMIRTGSVPEPSPQCRHGRPGCGYADQCTDF